MGLSFSPFYSGEKRDKNGGNLNSVSGTQISEPTRILCPVGGHP
jgi:hypothetical protein